MKLFNAIVGVLAIFGALYCIFWPEAAFLNAGWIVTLITFLWGVCGIVTYIIDRKYYNKKDRDIVPGAFGLIFGISICVLSIVATINDVTETIFLMLVLILLMGFLAVTGIRNIVYAVQLKHSKKPKGWLLALIFGVIQVVLVFVGLLNWIFTAGGDDFTNILIGLMVGVFGMTLIGTVFLRDEFDRWGEL